MNLSTWIADLAARGLPAVAPTTAVPVELFALLPDGGLLHFRCRGTGVTLRRFNAEDVSVALPTAYAGTDPEALALADVRSLRAAGPVLPQGRVVIPVAAEPTTQAAIDGAERFGWTGFEAGRLSVAAAAALLDELLAELAAGETAVAA